MNETQTAAVHPLEEMGISREVVQAFDWMGFQNLTAIQQKCIPLMTGTISLRLRRREPVKR